MKTKKEKWKWKKVVRRTPLSHIVLFQSEFLFRCPPDDYQTDTIASNLYFSDVSIIHKQQTRTEKAPAGGQLTEFDSEENVLICVGRLLCSSFVFAFGWTMALCHTCPRRALAAHASHTLVNVWNYFVVDCTNGTPPIDGINNNPWLNVIFLGLCSTYKTNIKLLFWKSPSKIQRKKNGVWLQDELFQISKHWEFRR